MTASIPSHQADLEGRYILIVEDADVDRMLLETYLRKKGCQVHLAHNGQEGIKKAQLLKPDIILMDVRMPVCDGLSACRQLKGDTRTRDIPVIFISGAVMPDERVEGLLAGAVDYVSKPFNFEEVRIRLSLHLRTRKSKGSAEPMPQPAASASNLDTILFQSARQQLIENLATAPNLEQLAHQLRTNPKRLNGAFRNCVGLTVFSYLREERMRQARALLADTPLEVQTIALELGFTNGANFATAFKERFGLTPLQFRQSSSGGLAPALLPAPSFAD